MTVTSSLVQKLGNPPRIARLVEEEQESTVLSVRHHKGPLANVVVVPQMQRKRLKFGLNIAVNAHRLSVPIDPNGHALTPQSVRRCRYRVT